MYFWSHLSTKIEDNLFDIYICMHFFVNTIHVTSNEQKKSIHLPCDLAEKSAWAFKWSSESLLPLPTEPLSAPLHLLLFACMSNNDKASVIYDMRLLRHKATTRTLVSKQWLHNPNDQNGNGGKTSVPEKRITTSSELKFVFLF